MTAFQEPAFAPGLAPLRPIAQEVLAAFDAVARSAEASLGRRGENLDDLAVVNQATAEATARGQRERNEQRVATNLKLRREPAIARLVIADEDDRHETIYITSSGTPDHSPVRMCSYLSPKGQLAPLDVGGWREIALPGGRKTFEVIDKLTFRPVDARSGWDSHPAVRFREGRSPVTIKSLRTLLEDDGFSTEEIDELEAFLRNGDGAADDNVTEGLKRETLTAMELRVAPILDTFQDRIFRLPLESQIAVLGPPGTGKTTTLVKRLRQKVDFLFLDPDTEQPLVGSPDAAGLIHADSWIMFSPTELLRQYVKDAFGEAGVPASDERVRTWDDYRREIGRRHLRVLRDGTGSGLVVTARDDLLATETLANQIAWFEAFDAHQQRHFVEGLALEAGRLTHAVDQGAAVLGRQIEAAIARSSERPLQLIGELAGLFDRLRAVGAAQRDETRNALREPLRGYARQNPGFLSALLDFVIGLDADDSEEAEDEDADGDEDDGSERREVLRGGRLAEDAFIKAMRARAIAQASGRSPNARTRAGRLLEWLRQRELPLPELRRVGDALLVQRAAQRLARAPADYLNKVPLRYRRFRREMRDDSLWYGAGRADARAAHPAEVDLIVLTMLRTARSMESDQLLSRRLGDRVLPMIETIARLRRNQVLVDEATDFSPVQLACMRALASPNTDSFFLAGDFNQRLTRWGSRSEQELRWVSVGLQIERINVSYRQSRKLADFARTLGDLHGYQVDENAPDHIDNPGVAPVLGHSLSDGAAQTAWLSARIREINHFTDGALPTIAILVCDAQALDPLAESLSAALADMNIKAAACPRGLVKGQKGDVRIFEVEHIKGLEFEAVFFLDVDELRLREPELFDRYLYVGATRAATFLGLTCRGNALPEQLASLRSDFAEHW